MHAPTSDGVEPLGILGSPVGHLSQREVVSAPPLAADPPLKVPPLSIVPYATCRATGCKEDAVSKDGTAAA